MAMVKWDPFRSFMRWPSIWDEDDWPISNMSEQLDVYETKDEVVVKANVAGVDEDKVSVTFEKGVLTVSAKEEEETKEGKKYYQKSSRSYSYRVAVPGNIDAKKEPRAEIEKGVLEIRFVKAEEAKPKQIAVKRKSK